MKRIIYDYEKPHIVGRAKRSFPLAKVIIFIITATLAVALIYLLFFKGDEVKYESKEYFAVVGKYGNKAESTYAAEQIKAKGGGGYLLDDFTVVVATYPNEADALAVADRYGYDVESLGKSTVKIDLDDKEVNAKVANLCSLPENIFDTVYTAVILYDSGELSVAALDAAVNSAIELIDQSIIELNDLKKIRPSDKLLQQIEQSLNKISSSLKREGLYSLSSQLKYALTEIVFIYKSMLKSAT